MDNATAPNAKRLLWAGFFAIFAAGVGFGVRTGVLAHWARIYGFTQTELGAISGGGLTGFGIIIIIGSFVADRIGYGRLMVFAIVTHLLSAGLQLATDPIYHHFGGEEAGRQAVKNSLTIAMFLFAIGNGTCEVVVNPMVAALFPNQKTHYLNILHAGWPGGLIAGGLISYFMNQVVLMHWLVQMSMFLIPVAIYAFMLVGQRMPRSEASQAGVSFRTMLTEFAAPILLLLLVIHAMVGYVELGTDSWMPDIVSRLLGGNAMLLFIYTSALMFALRFFAGPIEHQLSPLGLLFFSAVIAAVGLTLFGSADSILMFVIAATVYGIGKTFFWPTMLAVVSERFPRGGALTLGMIGGIGMLSAGELGAPGIGFKQDYYVTQDLTEDSKTVATYQRYAAAKEDSFLIFSVKALDGQKVGVLDKDRTIATLHDQAEKKPDQAKKLKEAAQDAEKELKIILDREKDLAKWWDSAKSHAAYDDGPINQSKIYGGRMAFRLTAAVPAVMAILYLFLIVYFKLQGGYKRVQL